jgi:hypothetical protein
MPEALMADDVVAAAAAAEAALRRVAGRDWSVRAGTLEWDVEQTIAHMIGAMASYTLYLASRCEHFIGVAVTRWPDATNEEVVDSVVPVAAGLAAVAAATPPDVRAYQVGQSAEPSGTHAGIEAAHPTMSATTSVRRCSLDTASVSRA